jgi:hypothetical protein
MGERLYGKDAELLYAGLRELVTGSFPRRCRNCGAEYASVEDWLARTAPVPRGSGLKAAPDDSGAELVELFRNCTCGSTLMETFDDRRDLSAAGERRRRYFGRLLEALQRRGMDRAEARAELMAARRGQIGAGLRALLASGVIRRPE